MLRMVFDSDLIPAGGSLRAQSFDSMKRGMTRGLEPCTKHLAPEPEDIHVCVQCKHTVPPGGGDQ